MIKIETKEKKLMMIKKKTATYHGDIDVHETLIRLLSLSVYMRIKTGSAETK